MRPAYEGASLVNLMASIVASRGGAPLHPLLESPLEIDDATNVVLLIVDGLGDNVLARRAAGGELARRRRRAITSVFPSTTASAITTSYTGRTPLEHGLTGWFQYFGEAGCVSAALPFRSRGDMAPLTARGVSAERVFSTPALFESMPVESYVVTYREIVNSDYNTVHCRGAKRLAYDSVDELVGQTERAVKTSDARKFVYAYWPHYDAASHRFGCESAQALRELEAIDAAFGLLIKKLSGTNTAIVVTADHGFIDVAAEESMELPGSLASRLKFPLCGERRVAYCHVHAPQDFAKRAKEWLGERADVVMSAELVADGWFGPGVPHARLPERVGDVALVMRGRYTVKDWLPGEPRWLHIGNHGGTHEDEMSIPLITEAA